MTDTEELKNLADVLRESLRAMCPWSLPELALGQRDEFRELIGEMEPSLVVEVTRAHYSLSTTLKSLGQQSAAAEYLETAFDFSQRLPNIDVPAAGYLCLNIWAAKAASLMVERKSEQAAKLFLALLFKVKSRAHQDTPKETIATLEHQLAYNASLAFRQACCFASAEAVLRCAYHLPADCALSVGQGKLPSKALSSFVLIKIVRGAKTIDDLLGLMAISSSFLSSQTERNNHATAALLRLVLYATHHCLAVAVLQESQMASVASSSPAKMEIEDIVVRICDQFIKALSSGRSSIGECMSSGIPASIQQADKVQRHVFMTVLDFCASFRTLEMWHSVERELKAWQVPKKVSAWVGDEETLPVTAPSPYTDELETKWLLAAIQELETAETIPIVADVLLRLRPASLHSIGGHCLSPNETNPEEGQTTEWQQASHVFIPTIEGLADPLFTDEIRQSIHRQLPFSIQRKHWKCLYSTKRDGFSIKTLMSNVAEASEVILVIQNAKNIYGAYLSDTLRVGSRYYGSGETFVFTIASEGEAGKEAINFYKWSERNEYFILCKSGEGIAIGGGTSGCAILLHNDLFTGNSYRCQTFNSPPLTSTDEGTGFDVFRVDAYGIIS
jgi:hypothetical protein